MPIPVQCPSCGHAFKVADEHAGKRARCHQCRQVLRIAPSSELAGQTVAPAGGKPADTVAEEKTKSASSDKTAAKKPSKLRRAEPLSDPRQLAEQAEPQSLGSPADSEVAATGFPAVAVDASPKEKTSNAQFSISAGDAGESIAAKRAGRNKSSIVPWLLAAVAIGLTVAGGAGYLIAAYFMSGDGGETPMNGSPVADRSPATPPTPKPVADPVVASKPVDEKRLAQQARQFTIRLRVSRENGTTTGSGFIINRDGWVATSYHLVRDANDVQVHYDTATGNSVAAVGLATIDPEHDLAVLVVSPSVAFTPAQLRPSPQIADGKPLFMCAMPLSGDRWVQQAAGATQMRSVALPPSAKQVLRDRGLDDTFDLTWIKHDISAPAGGEGSPLLDGEGHVVGITTLLGETTAGGYAIDSRHLAALSASLPTPETVQIQPFKATTVAIVPPTPQPPDPPVVPAATEPAVPAAKDAIAEQIDALMELNAKCAALNWYPATSEQYTQYQEFAEMLGKLAVAAEQSNISAADRQRLQETVARVVDVELDWSDLARQREVNRFAEAAVTRNEKRGIFGFAEVALSPDQIRSEGGLAAGFQLIGTNEIWLIRVTSGSEEMTLGSRWLIFGNYEGRIKQPDDPPADQPAVPRVSLVEAKYLIGFPAVGE